MFWLTFVFLLFSLLVVRISLQFLDFLCCQLWLLYIAMEKVSGSLQRCNHLDEVTNSRNKFK